MSEVLTLSTIVERDTINIVSKRHPRGKLYELANLADLGPYEYAIVTARNEELQPLLARKKLTPAQERMLTKALDDVVKLLLLNVEPSVLAALTIQQKEMIVFTWIGQVSKQGAAEGNGRPSRRTTAGSSRASKSSTAATRKPGGTRQRGS